MFILEINNRGRWKQPHKWKLPRTKSKLNKRQAIVGQITYSICGFFCGCKQSPNWEVHKLGNSFNVLRSNLHKNSIFKIFSKSCVCFVVRIWCQQSRNNQTNKPQIFSFYYTHVQKLQNFFSTVFSASSHVNQ